MYSKLKSIKLLQSIILSQSLKKSDTFIQIRIFYLIGMKNKSKKQEEKNNKNQNQKQKKIPGSIKKAQNKILIVVGAKPNSKQSKISQINDEYVGINIGAPPKQGEANQELLAHLSYVLDIKAQNQSIKLWLYKVKLTFKKFTKN